MPYVPTFDRTQVMMCSLGSFVDSKSIARVIDLFVDSLDLAEYKIKEPAVEGRPSYDPRGMYKLYIYGSRKGIRSSRKLAESCRLNIEVKWMLGGVEPDFRTISDFRKNNIENMKEIFHEFNCRISGSEKIKWKYVAVDGSKFSANNSKNRNFTACKLDSRIKWLDVHVENYLRMLDEMDEETDEEEDLEESPEKLTRKMLSKKLERAKNQLAKYEAYQKQLEESKETQLSLTDSDSRLMKNKNDFTVSYNPQTAVDSETHLIRDFNMTNHPTDHGLLFSTLEDIKKESPDEILEVVADQGYENRDDMVKCLESGIIPHVMTGDEKDKYKLEISYQAAEADATSTNPEELKKCLHAGVIPEAYKDVIEAMEVKEVCRQVKDESTEKSNSVYGTKEEMLERAMEGYFVRDPERNLVYCPMGEILRQKSIRKNGDIRYANRCACKCCPCKGKCFKGKAEFNAVDFSKDRLERPCTRWLQAEGKANTEVKVNTKKQFEKKTVVTFFLRPNKEKMSKRMCLSEHPFGSIKRSLGANYFLLKGMKKVAGEFALLCLSYNIERAKNIIGFNNMMKLMAGA